MNGLSKKTDLINFQYLSEFESNNFTEILLLLNGDKYYRKIIGMFEIQYNGS